MLLTYLLSHVQHEMYRFPISLPKRGTILRVLKKCLKINKQRSHLHKTLTILILISTV